jgi:hypothetical protein
MILRGFAIASVLILTICGLPGSIAASSTPNQQSEQEQNHPIKLQGLIEALHMRGLTQAEIIKRVKERGIDFTLTSQAEAALRKAGASDALIRVVKDESFWNGLTPVNPPDPNGHIDLTKPPPVSMDIGAVQLTLGMAKEKVLADLRARYDVNRIPDTKLDAFFIVEDRSVLGQAGFTNGHLSYISRELNVDDASRFGSSFYTVLSDALGATEKVAKGTAHVTLQTSEALNGQERGTIQLIYLDVAEHRITIGISTFGKQRRSVTIEDAITNDPRFR